jgi:hypothetical protein
MWVAESDSALARARELERAMALSLEDSPLLGEMSEYMMAISTILPSGKVMVVLSPYLFSNCLAQS